MVRYGTDTQQKTAWWRLTIHPSWCALMGAGSLWPLRKPPFPSPFFKVPPASSLSLQLLVATKNKQESTIYRVVQHHLFSYYLLHTFCSLYLSPKTQIIQIQNLANPLVECPMPTTPYTGDKNPDLTRKSTKSTRIHVAFSFWTSSIKKEEEEEGGVLIKKKPFLLMSFVNSTKCHWYDLYTYI